MSELDERFSPSAVTAAPRRRTRRWRVPGSREYRAALLALTIFLCGLLALSPLAGSTAWRLAAEGAGSPGAGTSPQAVEPEVLIRAFELIRREYVGDISDVELLRAALRGMMGALRDRHSVYFTPEELRSFTQGLEGSYGGVGMQIGVEEDRIVIIAPFPNTPADKAGLRSGDVILAVDGKDIAGLSVDQVAALIRGQPGTEVVITIRRPGGPDRWDVTVTREIIQLNTVRTEVIEGPAYGVPGKIGLLQIISFNDGTSGEVRRALEALEAQGIGALLLDLRGNPGGFLHEAIEVARLFVPAGPVVHVMWKTRGRETHNASGAGRPYPVVTLVDGGSASASEIVAGAIQDRGVGPLVGTRTFGKGSVQSLWDLDASVGALKITTARYHTPDGKSIDGVGLTPDVVVEREARPAPAGTPAPAQPEAPEWNLTTPLEYRRPLRAGMVGLDVLALQERLNALGYAAGVPDGIFGPRTQAAVVALQRAQGVPATGVFDEATHRALLKAIADKLRADAARSGQGPAAPAGRIEDRQILAALDWLRNRLSGR